MAEMSKYSINNGTIVHSSRAFIVNGAVCIDRLHCLVADDDDLFGLICVLFFFFMKSCTCLLSLGVQLLAISHHIPQSPYHTIQ